MAACWVVLSQTLFLALGTIALQATSIGEIIDAVNCGGSDFTDSYGVSYRGDPLEGRAGVASDHGRRFLFGRVDPKDQPLFQTERYAHDNLEYVVNGIPSNQNADYVLVMKFSEVWFSQPEEKVFSIVLNEEHMVVKDLDIFARVGKAVAHEEVIPFRVEDGKLRVQDEVSDFHGLLKLTFVKSPADNPKINAFYVLKGRLEQVPPLPPLDDPEEMPDLDVPGTQNRKSKDLDEDEEPYKPSEFASGPKIQSPYELQDQTSIVMPLLVAMACVVPVILCLCRM